MNLGTVDGTFALMLASESSHDEVVKLLQRAGTDSSSGKKRHHLPDLSASKRPRWSPGAAQEADTPGDACGAPQM